MSWISMYRFSQLGCSVGKVITEFVGNVSRISSVINVINLRRFTFKLSELGQNILKYFHIFCISTAIGNAVITVILL